jgi:hypothetical protein
MQSAPTASRMRLASAAHRTVSQLAERAPPAIDKAAAGARQAIQRIARKATDTARAAGWQSNKFLAAHGQLPWNGGAGARENLLAALALALAADVLLSRWSAAANVCALPERT